jgi:hypothetical protein
VIGVDDPLWAETAPEPPRCAKFGGTAQDDTSRARADLILGFATYPRWPIGRTADIHDTPAAITTERISAANLDAVRLSGCRYRHCLIATMIPGTAERSCNATRFGTGCTKCRPGHLGHAMHLRQASAGCSSPTSMRVARLCRRLRRREWLGRGRRRLKLIEDLPQTADTRRQRKAIAIDDLAQRAN